MTKKVAVDWDEQQIRIVVGEVSGKQTRIVDAAILPIQTAGVGSTLRKWIQEHGLEKSECLVAVGRDSAELRQMEFPPVPDDELPDMIRFQAVRTFASAGDSATVDYLPTSRTEKGVRAIVSATGASKLDPIRKAIGEAGMTVGRIALRPIAAAALYQIILRDKTNDSTRSTLALIDLVGDEAEIVLFRGRDVSFVRSVRLPSQSPARVNALAGELRRSMIACGASGSPCDIAIWGTPDRHREELDQLAARLDQGQDTPSEKRLINPLQIVDCDPSVEPSVGETVGRLAPLVGLLVADEAYADRLIDFANPRQYIPPSTNRGKMAAMIGIPAAIVLGLGWMFWSQLSSRDSEIKRLEAANATMRDQVKTADASVQRTERVDQFLDADVNWLEEIERLAAALPPSDQLILKQVSAQADSRQGGGRMVVSGLVTSPDVIDEMESSLRDESHRVVGDGASQVDTEDAYRWQIRETVSVETESVRADRYERIAKAAEEEPATKPSEDGESTPNPDAPSSDQGSQDASKSASLDVNVQPEVQS
ncbi:MAG TPA: hypothetical protein DDX19_00440 [Rhodopirellula baltica]|uniref:Competence protein A n=1 Tax=Rhodopirellula baltica (strain DSM 10527 / NCIMB 13988 / SH1) TaxID=243090 RepID=Q7URQ4_RHOBA|nr:hypothetical protein [Rhodopirellula baltica]CAD74284.1 conserved hypothetical protein [Rhodopirellula baltica SH 1]HBE61246.1 hypothetical protein [Rhodopirellula baltica]